MRKVDNLTTNPVPLSCNLGTLPSWNPLGHSRPVTGLLYLLQVLYLQNFATKRGQMKLFFYGCVAVHLRYNDINKQLDATITIY